MEHISIGVGGESLFSTAQSTEQRSPKSDPDNPINWTLLKKWNVTLFACYITFIVGLNATALTAVTRETNATFGISDNVFPNSVWPVTAWNVGGALAPMVMLPVMEDHGTKPGYLVMYTVFFIFVIPQAVAHNFATFVSCRFFAGCCGATLQDAMDGIIADIWEKATERSLPVSCYVLSLLAGVSIGPVIGGAITQSLDWRWVFYIQLIIYAASAPGIVLIFSETRYSIICAERSRRARQQLGIEAPRLVSEDNRQSPAKSGSLKDFLAGNILRPFHLLTTEPVVLFFTLLSALSYGLLFLATQSVPQVYGAVYAFSESSTGLVQSAIVIGESLGFLACICIQDPYFSRASDGRAKIVGGSLQLPEVRLYLAVPSSFLGLVGGLFVYGWTSSSDLTSWLPATGLSLLGFGSMVVMQAVMMYITDSYDRYAASASAAVCFGENIFAAFLPLASQSVYTELGFRWASSLLGFLALALSFAPILFVCKGQLIRGKSPFMKEAIIKHDRTGQRQYAP